MTADGRPRSPRYWLFRPSVVVLAVAMALAGYWLVDFVEMRQFDAEQIERGKRLALLVLGGWPPPPMPPPPKAERLRRGVIVHMPMAPPSRVVNAPASAGLIEDYEVYGTSEVFDELGAIREVRETRRSSYDETLNGGFDSGTRVYRCEYEATFEKGTRKVMIVVELGGGPREIRLSFGDPNATAAGRIVVVRVVGWIKAGSDPRCR